MKYYYYENKFLTEQEINELEDTSKVLFIDTDNIPLISLYPETLLYTNYNNKETKTEKITFKFDYIDNNIVLIATIDDISVQEILDIESFMKAVINIYESMEDININEYFISIKNKLGAEIVELYSKKNKVLCENIEYNFFGYIYSEENIIGTFDKLLIAEIENQINYDIDTTNIIVKKVISNLDIEKCKDLSIKFYFNGHSIIFNGLKGITRTADECNFFFSSVTKIKEKENPFADIKTDFKTEEERINNRKELINININDEYDFDSDLF